MDIGLGEEVDIKLPRETWLGIKGGGREEQLDYIKDINKKRA